MYKLKFLVAMSLLHGLTACKETVSIKPAVLLKGLNSSLANQARTDGLQPVLEEHISPTDTHEIPNEIKPKLTVIPKGIQEDTLEIY